MISHGGLFEIEEALLLGVSRLILNGMKLGGIGKRTPRNGVQDRLRVPNSEATRHRQRIAVSSHFEWFPPPGRSSYTWQREHVWLGVNLSGTAVVAAAKPCDSGKGVESLQLAGKGRETVWEVIEIVRLGVTGETEVVSDGFAAPDAPLR